ncbi:MAG: hypothetical protein IJF04_00015 [Oscillospiraceae bacterium]|nr:hypothetical protein [Oscillospiraceae bacterium]MBQ3236277.1 hypothetical protein [Oscillospiraceae bacterium]
MEVLFATSIFYIGYGIMGLFGKMNIAEKYKGHEWTKSYMKELGIADILLGVPWLILYFACTQYDPGFVKTFLFIIILALPAFFLTVHTERKYSKLLKKD